MVMVLVLVLIDHSIFVFPLQPVHINAGFALSRDRRSILSGSDIVEKKGLVYYNQGKLGSSF